MKNKTYFTLGLLLLGLLLALLGCRPDKKEDPVNPCAGKTIPKGEIFVTDNSLGKPFIDPSRLFSVETLAFGVAHFSTTIPYESYQWQVGSDPRVFTSKTMTMQFPDNTFNVPVRMIGRRKVDSQCFPNDDGLDTLRTTVSFTQFAQAQVLGTYYGYDTLNPADKFSVEVKVLYGYDSTWDKTFIKNVVVGKLPFVGKHHNLDEGYSPIRLSSSAFVGQNSGPISYLVGYLQKDRRTIYIEFESIPRDENGDIIGDIRRHQFIGIKQ
jgi:hypothetical protein